MKPLSINLGPFPYGIYLCLDEESFQALLKRLRIKPYSMLANANARTHFYETDSGLSMAVITLDKDEEWEDWDVAGMLAHEASHAINGMFEHIGEEKPGDEFRAYMIETVVKQCYKAYFKEKNKDA